MAGTHSDSYTIHILDLNIICADALDPAHTGWSDVGYMWSLLDNKFFGPSHDEV